MIVRQRQRKQEPYISYNMTVFLHRQILLAFQETFFYCHVLNGFTDYMPISKHLGKVCRNQLLFLWLLHAHISKQLNNYHHVSMQNIFLQSQNIMAPDTLNREVYFWLCLGNNCLHCIIWIEYFKYPHKNSNPLKGIILFHNGSIGHRTPSFPHYLCC